MAVIEGKGTRRVMKGPAANPRGVPGRTGRLQAFHTVVGVADVTEAGRLSPRGRCRGSFGSDWEGPSTHRGSQDKKTCGVQALLARQMGQRRGDRRNRRRTDKKTGWPRGTAVARACWGLVVVFCLNMGASDTARQGDENVGEDAADGGARWLSGRSRPKDHEGRDIKRGVFS